MTRTIRALMVEDSSDDAALVLRSLRSDEFEVEGERVETEREMRVALVRQEWDVILCDYSMPGFSAPAALEVLSASGRDIPFIIVSGTIGEENAVDAMRAGADDYVMKHNLARLAPAVERACRESAVRQERAKMRDALTRRDTILKTIGMMAERLLAQAEWDDIFPEVLKKLGETTSVSRTWIFEVDRGTTEAATATLRYEWADSETLPLTAATSRLAGFSLAGAGFGPWASALSRGETFQEVASDGASERKKILQMADIQSLAVAPIFVRDVWWGFIGASESHERVWSEHELGALVALANTIGAAMDRSTLTQELTASNTELRRAYNATLEGWASALDLRDRDIEGHSRRVTEMTVELAKRMGIDGPDLIHIRRGALLHDIGKLGIPDRILHKPGPLTDQEWEEMKMHPVYAGQFLSDISFLRPALPIPCSHHEHWDGNGYPSGLKEEEIPLSARIFAVVDAWDAMSFDRPYRKAMPEHEVLATIRSEAGTRFDPAVVDVFLDLRPWEALPESIPDQRAGRTVSIP